MKTIIAAVLTVFLFSSGLNAEETKTAVVTRDATQASDASAETVGKSISTISVKDLTDVIFLEDGTNPLANDYLTSDVAYATTIILPKNIYLGVRRIYNLNDREFAIEMIVAEDSTHGSNE